MTFWAHRLGQELVIIRLVRDNNNVRISRELAKVGYKS
jgi:hypothetical protein